MGKLYNDKSIESLSPLEFTRLRPGVYAGDTTYSTQLLVEVFSNAVDEFNLGHGTQIDVTVDKDIIKVRDYGQGFLVNNVREDGKTILEAAFSVLNTSGKYREDGTYEGTSLGSFGVGCKITTFLSHYLAVQTWRDGQTEKLQFKEGVFDKREVKKSSKESGTYVEWQPSEQFFTHTEIEFKKIDDVFKTITALCPGLTINFDYNGKSYKYQSKNGLSDLADAAVKDELISNRFILNWKEGKYKLDLVMTFTAAYSSSIVAYANTGLTEAGPHISQMKTAITRIMNKFFKAKGWLKEQDENLSGENIQEGMYLIFNITSPAVFYDSQVKSKVTKIDNKAAMNAFSSAFEEWLNINEKDIKTIADKAILARKAAVAARKARDAARNVTKNTPKGLKAKMAISDKFIDCKSKNPKQRVLHLVEG